MATKASWLNGSTILVEWCSRLTVDELRTCFRHLAEEIGESAHPVDVVFDVSRAGHIPVELPNLAVHSGFLGELQTGNVVLIGKNHWAQILAKSASRTTGKPIEFFRSFAEAAQAFQWNETSV